MIKRDIFIIVIVLAIMVTTSGCTDLDTELMPSEIAETATVVPTQKDGRRTDISDFNADEYLDKPYTLSFTSDGEKRIVYFKPQNEEVDYIIVTTDNNTYYVLSQENAINLNESDFDININEMVVKGYKYNGELVNECIFSNIMFYDIEDKKNLVDLSIKGQDTEYLYVTESKNYHKQVSMLKIKEMKNLKVVDFSRSIKAVNIKYLSELPRLLHLRLTTHEATMPYMKQLRKLEIGYANHSDDVLMGMTGFSDLTALQDMENLEDLCIYINYIKNLDDFKNLHNLKKLTLDYCTELEDVSGLANLQCLEEIRLNIRMCEVDFSGLEKIKSLKKLAIYGSSVFRPHIADWEVLGNVTQLETLHISADENKIGFLSNLTNLKDLTLNGDYKNVDAIYGMENLETLCLSGEFLNIDAVGSLTNLKELDLVFYSISPIGSPWMYEELVKQLNIDEIQKLRELEMLKIFGASYINSVKPIAKLSSLKKLEIGNGYLGSGIEDISFLYELEELENLSINLQGVNDISPVFSLSNLRKMELIYGTGEYDFSKLTNLEEIVLWRSTIESLDTLSELTELKKIFIHTAGRLSDISGIENLINLECLYLYRTGFFRFSELEELYAPKDIVIKQDGYYIFE